ncbi:MAG: rod shape-determining protein MreD [Bacteroidetes bacterium]|nr:MAG: rod shape-determining protein MreD [Bacteroidota bacterium]
MTTSKVVFYNVIRFFLLLLLQVLILNNIYLGGFINPYFYVYFILLLPYEIPGGLLLILSFLTGASIDLFTNTLGLNISACLAMAYARPQIIRLISSGPDSLIGDSPSLKNQGLKWFLYYSISLILIHHFVLFYLEAFRFSEFIRTFVRMALSGMFTLLLVLISEYLFYPKEK